MPIFRRKRQATLLESAEAKELIIQARRLQLAEWKGGLQAIQLQINKLLRQIEEFEHRLA